MVWVVLSLTRRWGAKPAKEGGEGGEGGNDEGAVAEAGGVSSWIEHHLLPAPPAGHMERSQLAHDNGERITDLLLEIRGGHPEAIDRLFHAVYGELRRIAGRKLQGERPGHTLGTTGLVHETYLKLADQTRVQWQDRSPFYKGAAVAMRRVLGGYARRHPAKRRGGGRPRGTPG